VTTRPRARLLIAALAAALLAATAAVTLPGLLRTRHPGPALPLRRTGELALPGHSSRFDYESLDPGRGLLFIAHLGDSQVIETDIRTSRVVRVISGLAGVHGVLVVPALHRVYATATAANQMAAINEDTGQILHRTPTGDYPTAWPTTPPATPSGPPTRPAAPKPSSTPPPAPCAAPSPWAAKPATSPTTRPATTEPGRCSPTSRPSTSSPSSTRPPSPSHAG
jgi:hypothetical protein